MKTLTEQARENIKEIHELSRQYNGGPKKAHEDKLLSLMRKHIDEIEELRKNGDEHYLTETGDLLILCYEMLLENSKSIDEMTSKCFERYEKKLNELIVNKTK